VHVIPVCDAVVLLIDSSNSGIAITFAIGGAFNFFCKTFRCYFVNHVRKICKLSTINFPDLFAPLQETRKFDPAAQITLQLCIR